MQETALHKIKITTATFRGLKAPTAKYHGLPQASFSKAIELHSLIKKAL